MYADPYPSPTPSWPALSYPVNEYSALDAAQVDGSIGPSRVLTRRQRAALEHAPTRRGHPEPYDTTALHRMYISSQVPISRPQTPPNQPEYPSQHLALNIPPPVVQPSPTYHPLTPSSSSSPYSTYGFYSASHSRSNSISNTTNPRSASPALSTISVLTSVSSSASGATHSASGSFVLPPTPESLVSRAKQKKQRLFNVDRKAICLYHKNNPNARQEDIARIYGVERSTISKILKNKTKWLNVPENENLRIAKHRPSKFPEIEEDMVKWLLHCRDTNVVLSDSMIRNKAKEIARALGIQEDRFKASSGWIENFKHRHGVRAGVWTGDGKNVRAARALGLGPPPDEQREDGIELRDAPGSSTNSSGNVRLSPLSPLCPGHGDEEDDVRNALGTVHDDDLEPELDEPEEVRVQRIAATGSGDIIRPSWLRNPIPPPPPQQSPQHSTVHNSAPPSHQPHPHPSVPPTRQLPEHSPYNNAPVFYDTHPQSDVVSYEASPPPPTPSEDTQHQPMYDNAPPQSHEASPVSYQVQGQNQPPSSPHDVYPSHSAPYTPNQTGGIAEAEAALDTVIRFFDTNGAAGLIRPDERNVLATIKCALFQAQAAQRAVGMMPQQQQHHAHAQYDPSRAYLPEAR